MIKRCVGIFGIFLVFSGRTRGGPVKKRCVGIFGIFLVFSGRARGGPVKKRPCGVVVFLVCCAIEVAINSNLERINNVYSHIYHIIPANCRRDFSAGGEALGAAQSLGAKYYQE